MMHLLLLALVATAMADKAPSPSYGPPKSSYEDSYEAPAPSYGPPPKSSYGPPKAVSSYERPALKGKAYFKPAKPGSGYAVHAIPAYIVPVKDHHSYETKSKGYKGKGGHSSYGYEEYDDGYGMFTKVSYAHVRSEA